MDSSPSSLERSLLAALAFFDLFDYPLTLTELRRFRYVSDEREATSEDQPQNNGRSSLGTQDVLQALAGSPVGQKDGFYFLAGREAVAGIRQRRYRLAERKFARARRAARLLGMLPSVRLAAVCNSLAISNADQESDIDLFTVCRPGTLWSTRLLVVGALALFGLRPRPGRHADTFCMSFFLSEDRLSISDLALSPEDTYLRYWIATLVPLYDAGGVMERFREANEWIEDRLPGVAQGGRAAGRQGGSNLRPAPRTLSPFERAVERFQKDRFPREINDLANKDTRVVIADDMLKFHVNDRRAYFEGRFREKLRELGIKQEASSCELRASSDVHVPRSEAHSSKLTAQSSQLR